MNYKMIGRFLAQIISIEAVFLLPALGISLGYGEWNAVRGFLYTLAIMVAVAVVLFAFCRKAEKLFGVREGMVCVSFSWIVLSLLGCLPFFFAGAIPSFVDALFEIVAGFSTTGATILPEVESLAKGLLYWRSFSHWLGGMGVLVFLLAVAPSSGKEGFTMHLMRAESPGPDVGKLVPRLKQTAMILYLIYIVMTIINVIFLLAGKMPVLEALCTAFGTAGTGGFGIKNDSLASYSPYIQNVTAVFMLLFGVNFSCYYLLLLRQVRSVLRDEELWLYIGIVIAAIALIAWNIYGIYGNLAVTLRHSAFQVSSVISSTGYGTANINEWPSFSKCILMILMAVGACAGSTGGGFKVARVLLLFKILRRNISQVLNPRKVQVIRNNGRPMDEKVLDNTNAYLAAYVIILVLSVLVVSLDGFDFMTNFSATLSCFNNIGPAFGAAASNYAGFSILSKIVLIIDMLLGRLEIFPMLVLLSRGTWSRNGQ